MNSRQPTGGHRVATGTGLLLAVLVSVSLVGAAIVQWSRDSDATPMPVANFRGGVLPGASPTIVSSNVVLSRDYGLWGYVATREPSGLNVDLIYRCDTIHALEEYVAMNRSQVALLARAGGDVDMLVTFRLPVAPAVFREWVAAHGMKADVSSVRLTTPAGAHGTLTVGAQESDPLPQDALTRGQGNSSTIEGVYSVRGTVPAASLPAVASDSVVYLADVTPTLARLALADVGLPEAQTATINSMSPFKEMEALGLVPR